MKPYQIGRRRSSTARRGYGELSPHHRSEDDNGPRPGGTITGGSRFYRPTANRLGDSRKAKHYSGGSITVVSGWSFLHSPSVMSGGFSMKGILVFLFGPETASIVLSLSGYQIDWVVRS